MKRTIVKLSMLATAVALTTGGLALTADAAPPPPATGDITCVLKGTASLTPGLPLTSPGAATKNFKTKFAFTGTLTGCTGAYSGGKVPITAGTVKAKGTTVTPKGDPMPSCLGLASGGALTAKTDVKWTGLNSKGKTVTAAKTKTVLNLDSVDVGNLSFDLIGVVSKGGFLDENATTHAKLDLGAAAFATACSAPGGLASLPFTGVTGNSTVHIAP